jgi:demethylmenaquinone methyltransferase / 2-methoxy-6-polyprenyl-1,4-benzoquinol methylase
MLEKANGKKANGRWLEADALQLPTPDASFDLATIAFGFRNLTNYRGGLIELRRILKPGGTLAILEFSTPPNPLLASLYGFYSRAILPIIGGMISGSKEAYTYLPESVRKFPDADGLANQMRDAGFVNVRFERMTFGIVALHLGDRG